MAYEAEINIHNTKTMIHQIVESLTILCMWDGLHVMGYSEMANGKRSISTVISDM